MSRTRMIGLVGVLALGAGMALADKPRLQSVGNPIEAYPMAVGKIDATGRLLTPMIPLPDPGVTLAQPCGTLMLFDNFEPNGAVPGLPTDNTYGFHCDPDGDGVVESHRWFFGTGYLNPFATNDYQIAPASCAGGSTQRIEFAWYLGVCPNDDDDNPGDGALDRHFIAVLNYDTFGDCTASQDRDNFIDGLIFGPFRVGGGPVTCNPGGYYFTDVRNLCEVALDLTMAPDGAGAYDIILGQDFVDSNGDGTRDTIILIETGQPMLWGCDQQKALNPAVQDDNQYDDDNPTDGQHNPLRQPNGECYDNYDFNICPNPLGAMMAFYNSNLADQPPRTTGGYAIGTGQITECAQACDPCDMNCDGSVNASDIQGFIDRLFNDADPCCGQRGQPGHSGDTNGDGAVNSSDIQGFITCLFG